MGISHETLVVIAKSFGLFYLLALSLGVVAYVYWPSRKQTYDRAARAILDDKDQPWR